MAIQDDFSVAANGDIRYTGTTANYTVIEFHRWLGDLMDNAESTGNDILDITDATASERSTDNIITLRAPYNIDDTAAEHLYDGSIIQDGGNTIYDGIVVFSPAGTYVDIIQNGALATNFWTTGLNDDANNGISHRFVIKVRTGGTDIDGRRLIGQTRELGKTYSEFRINGTTRGNNVIALSTVDDLNNTTDESTIATWNDITNTEGYSLLDVDNNSVNEAYYSEWDLGSRTINQFYERIKWLSRRGTSSTLYGINGALFRGITHQIPVDNPSGTFDAVEPISWATGTGILLATNSPTSPTSIYIQRLTGVAPVNDQVITGGNSTATCQVNGAVTEREISLPFCGASTGSALIGSYGFGVLPSFLTANDRLFDLTNTQRIPPNTVTFTVLGLVSGEDRVLVAPEDSGAIDETQFTLNGALTGAAVTSVVLNEAIPSDTPATGTLRILLQSGKTKRVEYTAFSGSTFTITSSDFSTDNAQDDAGVYISYIDKLATASSESFTVIYNSDRNLFIRVRDGGVTPIKTFETTATLGPSGGSASVIRTSDS